MNDVKNNAMLLTSVQTRVHAVFLSFFCQSNVLMYFIMIFAELGLPNEIQHHFSVSFPEVRCGQLNGLRASVEEEVDQTLSTIPGCVNDNACKVTNVSVPECGWTSNQKRRRSVGSTKKVLFSLSVTPSAAASLPDDIEEKSEAILFQMQYVVSTGEFSINFNGINSTADKSSFEHLSSNITCSPGFVSRNDETTCGKIIDLFFIG